jgi:hypothetical protein
MTEDEFNIGTIYISELLDVEYFSRIWCVQEFVASKVCIAKCEELEMDFFDLLKLVPYIVKLRGKMVPDKPLNFWAGIPIVREMYPAMGGDGSLGPLLSLLAATRDFKAMDPRDKVFALFGIADEGLSPELARTKIMGNNNSWRINLFRKAFREIAEHVNSNAPVGSREFGRPRALTPNYMKPMKELYRDLTRFFIRASPRVLDVLSHVQHTSNPSAGDFPSWVPKWNESGHVSTLSIGMFLAGFCDGHFRYFANVEDNPLLGSPKEPNKLHIEGFKIDQVVKVTGLMSFDLHGDWPAEQIWHQLFDLPLFPHSEENIMRPYRNGDRLDIAFLLAAMAFPLGTTIHQMRSQTIVLTATNRDEMLLFSKTKARADAAAFILAHTPLDTTALPHYTEVNSEAEHGNLADFHDVAKIFSHNRRYYLTRFVEFSCLCHLLVLLGSF